MRSLVVLLGFAAALDAEAQRILHFTATSGFDHGTRAVSFAMFQAIADGNGWSVVDDAAGTAFTDLAELRTFDAVVFSNTSGDAILDEQQRGNFETWVSEGGRVLGIHAASDTYRHSTANGTGTGAWDFYAELIGASVQQSPNHVSGTPLYAMAHIGTHASTDGLPDPWEKNEEYYYWLNGYYGPSNSEVLRVGQTVGPNGEVNDYDAPRPMSWYRELPNNGRVFYTALGHATSNYTDDAVFRRHIEQALGWLLEGATSVREIDRAIPQVFPNPAAHTVQLAAWPKGALRIHDVTGREMERVTVDALGRVDVSGLPNGIYMLQTGDGACVRVQVLH